MAMPLVSPKAARIISSVAATIIGLAAGTNYTYSAWGPQFAEKMEFSATQQNLIGLAANTGMYISGIPFGMLNDAKGFRFPTIIGAVCLLVGYYPFKYAYDNGPGTLNISALCFFAFLTGAGSSSSILTAIKTSALNWPHHRGTALGFPMAAMGLSAFLFSSIGSVVLHNDISKFLLLLALGTFLMVFVPFLFIRVVPPPAYEKISSGDTSRLHRRKSRESTERVRVSDEQDERHVVQSEESRRTPKIISQKTDVGKDDAQHDVNETASLLSGSSSSSSRRTPRDSHGDVDISRVVDIRGRQLLPRLEFWLLFLYMAFMIGVGLMNINNLGNDAKALWKHYDDSVSSGFISSKQVVLVSVLSLCSFAGRLISGMGSDLLVHRFGRSRLWCQTGSASILLAAQVCALAIENPNFLWVVASLNGLGYGLLWGFYPTLVAETFGIHGLSLNWGVFTLGPGLGGPLLNFTYGRIYDSHSNGSGGSHGSFPSSGHSSCDEGAACYRGAYVATVCVSLLGLALNAWCFHEEKRRMKRLGLVNKGDGVGVVATGKRGRGSSP